MIGLGLTVSNWRAIVGAELEENIVTCYVGGQPVQRFIARQQLRKYATVMETLLGTRPHVTMEV
jgi:hypothetical protein